MIDDSEHLLLHEVQPRLRLGIARLAPGAAGEDAAELLQDGLVIALQLWRRAQANGQRVSAGTLAYYTLKHLRAGRRSTGSRRTDPHHAAAQRDGRCRLHSLEEPISGGECGDDALTLGELLSCPQEDPASAAARRLDWAQLEAALDAAGRAIVGCLASGDVLTSLAGPRGRSRSSWQQHKERLRRQLQAVLGTDILRQVQQRPVWQANLRVTRERLAARSERALA